jgi:hypothetical protein
VMLDEIINYVQSLQRQIEFLSMKLAAVNPGMDCTVDDFLCKQVGKFYWIVAGTQSNFLGFFVRLQSFTEHVQNDNSQVL